MKNEGLRTKNEGVLVTPPHSFAKAADALLSGQSAGQRWQLDQTWRYGR
jgi:hypothetical protein